MAVAKILIRIDFQDLVLEALTVNKGSARLVDVAAYIWKNHRDELRASGDQFYTWQYDARWAATELRKQGKMKQASDSPRGIWELP